MGCGGRDDQARLIRLTVDQGRLAMDEIRGRGGYLHRSSECRQLFVGRKSQYRAFRVEVTRAMKENLIKELENRDRE
jgi:predicted RNA-binding protein YlxR (DUF448 family)